MSNRTTGETAIAIWCLLGPLISLGEAVSMIPNAKFMSYYLVSYEGMARIERALWNPGNTAIYFLWPILHPLIVKGDTLAFGWVEGARLYWVVALGGLTSAICGVGLWRGKDWARISTAAILLGTLFVIATRVPMGTPAGLPRAWKLLFALTAGFSLRAIAYLYRRVFHSSQGQRIG